MNKIRILSMLITLAVSSSCSASMNPEMNVMSSSSLVSERFISDTEYEIVCLGYPKEGLTGVQREESAKRAALLSAYYFANNRFGNTINPDRDGRTEKITMYDGYCEIRYVIKKSNLKNLKKIAEQRKQTTRVESIEPIEQIESIEPIEEKGEQ